MISFSPTWFPKVISFPFGLFPFCPSTLSVCRVGRNIVNTILLRSTSKNVLEGFIHTTSLAKVELRPGDSQDPTAALAGCVDQTTILIPHKKYLFGLCMLCEPFYITNQRNAYCVKEPLSSQELLSCKMS